MAKSVIDTEKFLLNGQNRVLRRPLYQRDHTSVSVYGDLGKRGDIQEAIQNIDMVLLTKQL